MAQIIWKPRAIRQLNAIIDYSVPEFGMVAFKRMDKRIQEIEKRLEIFPESFTIEPLLKNDKVVYRLKESVNLKMLSFPDKTLASLANSLTIWICLL